MARLTQISDLHNMAAKVLTKTLASDGIAHKVLAINSGSTSTTKGKTLEEIEIELVGLPEKAVD